MRGKLILFFINASLLARHNAAYGAPNKQFQQFSPQLASATQPVASHTDPSILIRYIVKSLKETLGLALESYKQVLERTRDDVTAMHEKSWDLQLFGNKIDNLLAEMEATELDLKMLSEQLLQAMMFPLDYMLNPDATYITLLNENGLTEASVKFRDYRDKFIEKFTAAVQKYIKSLPKEEKISKQHMIAAFENIRKSESKHPFSEIKEFVNKFLRFNA